MLADSQTFEKIIGQIKRLSPEYRLRLIQYITETLIQAPPDQVSKPLQFGKYKGNKMSTPDDFTAAEWRPTDDELNGR